MSQSFAASGASPSERATPDLGDPEVRASLSATAIEAMVNLAGFWRLSGDQTSRLIGDVPEAEWLRMRDEKHVRALSQETLTRISALVGVYKGLHLLFSEPLANDWVLRRNSDPIFAGLTPAEYMAANGVDAILKTRAYVDALRGGL